MAKTATNMLKIGDQEIKLTDDFLDEIEDRIIYDLLDNPTTHNKISKVFATALLVYLEKNIKQFDTQFKDIISTMLEDSVIDSVQDDASFHKMVSARVVALRNEVLEGMSDKKIKKLIIKKLSD